MKGDPLVIVQESEIWPNKTMEHEMTVIQMLGNGTVTVKNQRPRRDHSDYSIIKIDQNTEKSPWDLRRLDVIQTPVKAHQQKSEIMIMIKNFQQFLGERESGNDGNKRMVHDRMQFCVIARSLRRLHGRQSTYSSPGC